MPDELDRIRDINRYDCFAKESAVECRYWVYFPGDDQSRVLVPDGASMAEALHVLFDRAIERFAREQVAAMGPIRLHLSVVPHDAGDRQRRPTFDLELVDASLHIRRDGHELSSDYVTSRDLMHAIEWLASDDAYVRDADFATGTLRVGERAIPVSLMDFYRVELLGLWEAWREAEDSIP